MGARRRRRWREGGAPSRAVLPPLSVKNRMHARLHRMSQRGNPQHAASEAMCVGGCGVWVWPAADFS